MLINPPTMQEHRYGVIAGSIKTPIGQEIETSVKFNLLTLKVFWEHGVKTGDDLKIFHWEIS